MIEAPAFWFSIVERAQERISNVSSPWTCSLLMKDSNKDRQPSFTLTRNDPKSSLQF